MRSLPVALGALALVIGGCAAGQPVGADANPPDTMSEPDANACTPSIPSIETCDGIDNDCDPSTPDGAGDPMYHADCTPADQRLCNAYEWQCSAGAWACLQVHGPISR